MKQTDGDLVQTRTDAAQGQGDQCDDVSSVVYNDAASLVYNDVVSLVANAPDTVEQDLGDVHSGVTTANATDEQLAVDALPAPPSAAATISSAQVAVSHAVTATNADMTTAYQIANGLAAGACAGMGPGKAPNGASHIH